MQAEVPVPEWSAVSVPEHRPAAQPPVPSAMLGQLQAAIGSVWMAPWPERRMWLQAASHGFAPKVLPAEERPEPEEA